VKIESIQVREIAMRLSKPFETSFGVTQDRRIILVELKTDEGIGWGEVTAGEGPFYNPETTDTAWLILRNFIARLVVGNSFTDAAGVLHAMAPIRGHEMAKAAVENATWDVLARHGGVPLHSFLGGTQREIPCGVSLGIHSDIPSLVDKIGEELSASYKRIKLKIKPGKDVAFVEAARRHYPDIALTVDANSAYTLQDVELLKQLDGFNLTYIEQPLEWNEIYQHAALQRQLSTAICLDECIHGLRDAQAAVELEACKVINIKLGRVSGHTEAKRIQQYCLEHGIPVWCGGMLESGVGRAHNIAMSSLPGFVLPGDVSASKRYWKDDIIEPEVTVSSKGTIMMPDGPGLGFALRHDLIERLTVRKEEWLPRQAVSSYATA
jgi:o-succinylbenzoate synthase